MKKILVLMLVVALTFCLVACGKKCSKCGKSVGNGYELFGNFYCGDCFKRGIL